MRKYGIPLILNSVFLICLIFNVMINVGLFAQEIQQPHQMKVTVASDPNFVDIEIDPNVIKTYKVLDIANFKPESEYDKNVNQAIIIMFKDLYSLGDRHDKNMVLIGKDVDIILNRIRKLQDHIDVLEIRLDLLDGEVNKISTDLFSKEDTKGLN